MCPRPAYRPRVFDAELDAALAAHGAVVIEGARASGKTEAARRVARSEVRLDIDEAARAAGRLDPGLLLPGDRPRLIDEYQLVPGIRDHVRRAVDDSGGEPGQFILTGSSVVPHGALRHSGAGRIHTLRLRPMSLTEMGYSTGEISLARLMAGDAMQAGQTSLSVPELADIIATGGWPGLQDRNPVTAQAALRSYLRDTAKRDLELVDGVRRDQRRVLRVLQSVARYVATQASARRLAADVGGVDGPIKVHTVLDYLDVLEQVFVIEDLPAWAPALRSKSRLRDAAKRHFVDPSLAVAALGVGPDRLVREVDTLGLLFESLVVRDLRIYAQAIDAEVFHYHDNTDLEADAIVQLRGGGWGAFEVKLGQKDIDAGAESLKKVADRVDVTRHGPPAVLGVITGWGLGYRRVDGISIIPIRALSP